MSAVSLVVWIPGRDLNRTSIRHDYCLEESQWTAVFRRQELDLNVVAGMQSIRSGFTDPSLCQGRGGAKRQHPWGGRAIRILNRDRQGAVRIYEFHAIDRSR